MVPTQPSRLSPEVRAAMTFLFAACWIVLSLSATVVLARMVPVFSLPLPIVAVRTLLIFGGLYWIGRRTVPQVRPLSSIGLARRPSAARELALGAAVGWGIAIALLAPALLTLNLHASIGVGRYQWTQLLLGTLLLALSAVCTQLAFTGLAFQSLVRATSPTFAVIAFGGVSVLLSLATHTVGTGQLAFIAVAQFLFYLAALRTRGIWIPVALQFAWGWTMTLLFGVRSFYWPLTAGPVDAQVGGPRWWTGGALGPEASAFAWLVVAVAFVVLWRTTRDYAWHYTFDGITGAGYPMDVAPPVEHARMEAAVAARPPVLVQIAPGPVPDAEPQHQPVEEQ